MSNEGVGSDLADLIAGAERLGVALTPEEGTQLLGFLDLLYAWNAFAGFTAVDRRDAVRLHLLDSLALVPMLTGATRIADLGSGAGLPGIPLATCLNQALFTLVESKRRRCNFLREVIRQHELSSRVTVLEADAHTSGLLQSRQDAIVTRAFAPPQQMLILARPMLAPGGILILMCGGTGPEGLKDRCVGSGFVLEGEHRFVLPNGSEARSIATFRRGIDSDPDCFT